VKRERERGGREREREMEIEREDDQGQEEEREEGKMEKEEEESEDGTEPFGPILQDNGLHQMHGQERVEHTDTARVVMPWRVRSFVGQWLCLCASGGWFVKQVLRVIPFFLPGPDALVVATAPKPHSKKLASLSLHGSFLDSWSIRAIQKFVPVPPASISQDMPISESATGGSLLAGF